RSRDRDPRGPRSPRRRRDPVAAVGLAAATAAAEQDPRRPGDAAADHEAGDRGGDQRLSSVLAELAAPVRQRDDLGAQRLDRAAELDAVLLDRGADLLGRAGRHQEATSVAVTVSRIFFASSIAI